MPETNEERIVRVEARMNHPDDVAHDIRAGNVAARRRLAGCVVAVLAAGGGVPFPPGQLSRIEDPSRKADVRPCMTNEKIARSRLTSSPPFRHRPKKDSAARHGLPMPPRHRLCAASSRVILKNFSI